MDEIVSEQVISQWREKQGELIRLIEALAALDESKEWGVLKELVFDRSLKSIERQLLNESLSKEVHIEKIYKLQGEWAGAKQFCDLKRFVENLKAQLSALNSKLK